MASACAASPASTRPRGHNSSRTLPERVTRKMPSRNRDVDKVRRRLLQAGLAATACATSLARAAGSAAARKPTTLRTSAGRVRGVIDGDLMVFRGLRYGADTGPRRFQ